MEDKNQQKNIRVWLFSLLDGVLLSGSEGVLSTRLDCWGHELDSGLIGECDERPMSLVVSQQRYLSEMRAKTTLWLRHAVSLYQINRHF